MDQRVDERRCVNCGTPGRLGRFSCHECGGAVSEVRELAAESSAASPASWSTSDANGPHATFAYEAPVAAARPQPVGRSRASVVAASVMVFVLVAVALGAGTVIVRTYRENNKPHVPKELQAWASGEDARTFATKSFTISMPAGYAKASETWPTPGGTVHVTSARAGVRGTLLYVESGAVTKREASSIVDVVDTAGARIADVMHYAGYKTTGRQIKWQGARGVELKVKGDKSSAIARIVVSRGRIVVIAVASAHDARGVYDTLLASYQAR
jgi:hypothetical protein